MMIWNLDVQIVDVETAFLYSDLEVDVYMICIKIHGPHIALH